MKTFSCVFSHRPCLRCARSPRTILNRRYALVADKASRMTRLRGGSSGAKVSASSSSREVRRPPSRSRGCRSGAGWPRPARPKPGRSTARTGASPEIPARTSPGRSARACAPRVSRSFMRCARRARRRRARAAPRGRSTTGWALYLAQVELRLFEHLRRNGKFVSCAHERVRDVYGDVGQTCSSRFQKPKPPLSTACPSALYVARDGLSISRVSAGPWLERRQQRLERRDARTRDDNCLEHRTGRPSGKARRPSAL